MEFGRLPLTELDRVDFTLAAEPARNEIVLPGKPAGGRVYVGMPQWGRTEWIGKIYPPRTKERDFLSHYVKHFNSVELNATHYKLYGAGGIGKWADMARGIDFKFCPKMYKGITHKYPLSGKDFMVSEFLRGVETFGEHLGPIFIQLHDKFGSRQLNDLYKFMEPLPASFPFFLELRHPDLLNNTALFDHLQTKNIGLVITDTAGRRDCVHMNLTVAKTMVRFVCNNGHATDHTRINEWAKRIKLWLDKGIKEVYFFVHMEDEEKGLDMARSVIEKFNEDCQLSLPLPNFIKNNHMDLL